MASKTQKVDYLSNQQKIIDTQLRKLLQRKVNGGAGEAFPVASPYDRGPLTAPLVAGFGQVQNLIGSYNPMFGFGSEASAVSRLLNPGRSVPRVTSDLLNPQTTAKYFQQAVVNPMLNTFRTQIEPQIRNQFAGVGGFSSRQGQAGADALSQLSIQMSGQLGAAQMQNQQLNAQMNLQASQANANNSLQALGLIPQGLQGLQQMQMRPLQGALAMTQALSPFQQRADMGTQATYNDFLRMTQENSPWIQQAMQYLGQQHVANAKSGDGGILGNLNIGGALGGGLGGLIGTAAAIPGAGWGILGLGALAGGLGGLFGG